MNPALCEAMLAADAHAGRPSLPAKERACFALATDAPSSLLASLASVHVFLGPAPRLTHPSGSAANLTATIHLGAQLVFLCLQVIRNAKLWCDVESAPQAKKLSAMWDWTLVPGFTASKIAWLKENEPDNFKKLAKVLLPHDYFNYYLTGRYCAEVSSVCTQLCAGNCLDAAARVIQRQVDCSMEAADRGTLGIAECGCFCISCCPTTHLRRSSCVDEGSAVGSAGCCVAWPASTSQPSPAQTGTAWPRLVVSPMCAVPAGLEQSQIGLEEPQEA